MIEGIMATMEVGGNQQGGLGNWGYVLIGGAVGASWRGNNNGSNAVAFGETSIMDSLSGARTDINAIARD